MIDRLIVKRLIRLLRPFKHIITVIQKGNEPSLYLVLILKAQLACAVLMLVTAILYMLLYISASLAVRRGTSRVLIEHHQLPAQLVRRTDRHSSPPPQTWKSTTGPVTNEPGQIECPSCGTSIRLTQKRRYT